VYGELGFEMERLVVEELERSGLSARDADPRTPVIIQSFSAESLGILRRELGSDLPLVFLLSGGEAAEWLTVDGLERVKSFATGIGPAKDLLLEHPSAVELAHRAGLTVIPWTFRSDEPGAFASVGAEMSHFLFDLGVDGLFTNNPDLFPRTPVVAGS
jgi:glycerophosphoryl diester phosphodiesterase